MTPCRSAVVLTDRLSLAVIDWLNRFDPTGSIQPIMAIFQRFAREKYKKILC